MAAQSSLVSATEYLAGELNASIRHEFVAGSIYAMAGASWNHGMITRNLSSLLGRQFDEGPRVNLDQDIKVWVAALQAFYYPDQTISCPPRVINDRSGVIDNPTVVFEVLSPRTANLDRGAKFAAYRTLESLRSYVLIDSESPSVEVNSLEDVGWVVRTYAGLDVEAVIPSVEVRISLHDLFRRCRFNADEQVLASRRSPPYSPTNASNQ